MGYELEAELLTVSAIRKDKFKLAGFIDGSQDFGSLMGVLPAGVTLDCAEVTQINSTGIKAWMRYFCADDKKGLDIRFESVSIPLVEQLNMFRNFIGHGKVISISVPFRCEACNINFNKVYGVKNALQFKVQGATVPCNKCKGPAKFDDLPEEYFEFLGRQGALPPFEAK